MTKHPKDRGERRKLKVLHDNASPVFRLLKEKEKLDGQSKRDRVLPQRGNTQGLGDRISSQSNDHQQQ